MLRARKPEVVTKRLKLFMFGPAGVGKTTAAIQFPNSYIIDAERGTENYDKLITASGSSVFQTTDVNEVVQEVKALLTEKHDFRTLVIDPITRLPIRFRAGRPDGPNPPPSHQPSERKSSADPDRAQRDRPSSRIAGP